MAKHQKKAGTTGRRGAQGARGATGRRGASGKSGAIGKSGAVGKRGPQGPKGNTSPDVDAAIARLDRIQILADELAKCPRDVLDQLDVSTRIYNEIQAAKRALNREP
jgi:hypothetical protein